MWNLMYGIVDVVKLWEDWLDKGFSVIFCKENVGEDYVVLDL